MRRSSVVVAAALGVALLPGCKRKLHAPDPNPRVAPVAVQPTKELGTAPAPFGPFKKISIGMTLADARSLVPELLGAADKPKPILVDCGDDLRCSLGVYGSQSTIREFRVSDKNFNADLLQKLTTAWGPGLASPDQTKPGPAWLDATNGWHAIWRGPFKYVAISNYVPLTTLLGPGAAEIAALPKPVLGATLNELYGGYPSAFKALGKLTGGPVQVELLPRTDWDFELEPTQTSLEFDNHGKVVEYSFTIHDERNPHGADETMATFTRKWGPATEHSDHPGLFSFHATAGAPSVTVQRDSTHGLTWTVTISNQASK